MPSPSASNNWLGIVFDVGLSRAAGVCAKVRPSLCSSCCEVPTVAEHRRSCIRAYSGLSAIAAVCVVLGFVTCCLFSNLKPPDCIKQALPDFDAARRGYRWFLHGSVAAAKQSERKPTKHHACCNRTQRCKHGGVNYQVWGSCFNVVEEGMYLAHTAEPDQSRKPSCTERCGRTELG